MKIFTKDIISMFKIKENILQGSNFSFALPQDFNLILKGDISTSNKLEFVSDDGIIRIEMYFLNDCHSAKEDLQDVIDDSKFIKMGDFIPVKRGNGTATGIFFKSGYGGEEHYEERYDFKENEFGETQLDIDIYVWSKNRKLNISIYQALELPNVKAFLESLKYFT